MPLVAVVILAAGPGVASAAPPTPVSTTLCGGPLTVDPAPTPDDPNLVDYKFYCNQDITAYTLIVNRRLWDFDTLDDFDPTPQVIQPDGATSSTESVECSGTVPGSGINCDAGPGGLVSAWDNISGSFDLVEPYCKFLPPHAKPGTKATPQAVVQLVVTNTTGAENGPFRLNIKPDCPRVPDQVPFPPKPKPKPKPKHTHKKVKRTVRRVRRHA
jgi:hypothetical protein